MENQQTAQINDEDEKANVMLKYLKVVLMQNPFYNYFQYGNKLHMIFGELEKTYTIQVN